MSERERIEKFFDDLRRQSDEYFERWLATWSAKPRALSTATRNPEKE